MPLCFNMIEFREVIERPCLVHLSIKVTLNASPGPKRSTSDRPSPCERCPLRTRSMYGSVSPVSYRRRIQVWAVPVPCRKCPFSAAREGPWEVVGIEQNWAYLGSSTISSSLVVFLVQLLAWLPGAVSSSLGKRSGQSEVPKRDAARERQHEVLPGSRKEAKT